jgi:general secretion pathway protein K
MKRNQCGAALLAAMLTVTLVATIAAGALWQQWRSIEVESADRQRIQATWILTGALDWARLILREDLRDSSVDHLAEPWAVPLQEARLSTFLAADQGNNASTETAGADQVFLSGEISDLQSRLNLTSLLDSSGSPKKEWLEAFRRLFEVLGLPAGQLTTLATNLLFASDSNIDNLNAGKAPLTPNRTAQLVWLGLPPSTVATLEPYVTVLPQATPVNLNTAPAEVIYAVGKDLGLADAQRLVAERERKAFNGLADVKLLLPDATFDSALAQFSTRFFEVRGRLRIEDTVIEERSIVRRDVVAGTGARAGSVHTVQRERGASETFGMTAIKR